MWVLYFLFVNSWGPSMKILNRIIALSLFLTFTYSALTEDELSAIAISFFTIAIVWGNKIQNDELKKKIALQKV